MNKSIKFILAISTVVLVLLGVGLWYGASLVNPVQLTKLLSSSVKDATGRDLTIAGPVSLKIFPSICKYFSLDKLFLKNIQYEMQKKLREE